MNSTQTHPETENEDSPIKKRLRSRKEAAKMATNLEVMGSQFSKEKALGLLKPGEVKEKHLEVLRATNAGLNCTEKYYTESQKKIEVFMGENEEKPKKEEKVSSKENIENVPKPPAALPERPRSKLRTPAVLAQKPCIIDMMKPDTQLITKLLSEEKDERYHYLMRNGTVCFVEPETYTIFVELPQIPNITIAYRRPCQRIQTKKLFDLSKKQLSAVPLFEGEELLEELDLSKNMITRVENLVSLPKLQMLDLSHNKISQMTNMNTLQGLRTLDLSHNCIVQIDGLDYLKSLEVLNLQANLINRILGLSHLSKLRVLNLNGNMVDSLDGAEVVVSLKELHISKNNVNDMGRIQTLPRLEILDVSHNNIKTLSKECMGRLQTLKELRIEENPCAQEPAIQELVKKLSGPEHASGMEHLESEGNARVVASPFKNLANALSYAKTVEIEEKSKQKETASDDPQYTIEQKELIEKIRDEWKLEEEHVLRGKPSTETRTSLKTFLVMMEKGTVLHLWGAGALDSLTVPEYGSTVTELVFECIKFEHIVYPPVLQELRKYKCLHTVHLVNNCLSSYVLLSKLEVLDKVRHLTVSKNSVCRLATFEAFVTYRFQHVISINGKSIGPEAKKVAKQEFEKFDRSLAAATLANKKHVSYKKLGCSKAKVKSIAKENEAAAARMTQKTVAESEAGAKERKLAETETVEYVKSFLYSYMASLDDGSAYVEELD